jgi:PIN domain nuclease of toxin-antitoxin system
LGDPVIAYLDTHILAWLGAGKLSRLSSKAQKQLEKAELLCSPMAYLELEYLYELKRTKLPARALMLKAESETGLRICDLPFQMIASAALDEKWTRDPFDRVIVAHAKANGFAPLVSADETIRKYYPRTVW